MPRTLAGSRVALQPISNKEDKLIRVEATPLPLLTLPFAMRREPEKKHPNPIQPWTTVSLASAMSLRCRDGRRR